MHNMTCHRARQGMSRHVLVTRLRCSVDNGPWYHRLKTSCASTAMWRRSKSGSFFLYKQKVKKRPYHFLPWSETQRKDRTRTWPRPASSEAPNKITVIGKSTFLVVEPVDMYIHVQGQPHNRLFSFWGLVAFWLHWAFKSKFGHVIFLFLWSHNS